MIAVTQQLHTKTAKSNSSTNVNEGRGDFFAIDRRAWRIACDLGLNPAISYVMLARGTLADNRTTSWSVNATEGRTGVSRPKARAAIDCLIANGLIENLNASPTRPRRRLVPGHQLRQYGMGVVPLTKGEETIFAALPMDYSTVMAAATKGILRQLIQMDRVRFNGFQYLAADILSEAPDWIWLPNSLIDGAADETPPVEVLRQAQDVAPLRLLVDLYHAHSLTHAGGIPTGFIERNYGREEIAFNRNHKIWKFEEGDVAIDSTAPFMQSFIKLASGNVTAASAAFWDAFNVLYGLGYVHFVGHLFEGADLSAEIIHPFDCGSWRGVITEAEEKLYRAARETAISLLPDYLRPKHWEDMVAPVPEHIRGVEMRGVVRLRYRPRTMVTAQWLALSRSWDRRAESYRHLADERGVAT